MNAHRSATSVQALQAKTPKTATPTHWLFLAVAVLVVLFQVLNVAPVNAQFPRLGVSASPDHYVDPIDVFLNEEFELYICVFGVDEETPLAQEFSSIAWVLHQSCCGAALLVNSVDFNPNFEHFGIPSLGVISSSEVCVDEPSIVLATIHANMIADEDGAYLVAAGPYQAAYDCAGESPVMMGMAITINLTGISVPTENQSWNSVKALYR